MTKKITVLEESIVDEIDGGIKPSAKNEEKLEPKSEDGMNIPTDPISVSSDKSENDKNSATDEDFINVELGNSNDKNSMKSDDLRFDMQTISDSTSVKSKSNVTITSLKEHLTRRARVRRWFKKYFGEGQHLDPDAAEVLGSLPENPTWQDLLLIKYRKYTAMAIPFLLVQALWWCTAIKHHFLPWYKHYWEMPLTMVLGSFVGGMTSEGSAAIAFPVMTIALNYPAPVARDFSLMIQSIGMTSAMFCVLFMKVKFEPRAVILGTVGAIPGFIFGIYLVDPHLGNHTKKMLFVSIWFAFAISLAILNFQKKRQTFREIPEFNLWKAVVLIFTGFIGGIMDSFAGSGVDICIFSVCTLLFRVTEKTTTPTTVVLKGVNSMFGFFWRAVMMGNISQDAWHFFALSVPVSSVTGPLGSFVGSHLHRQVIAFAVYILEVISLVGFWCSRPTWELVGIGLGIIAFSTVLFAVISKFGHIIMDGVLSRQEEAAAAAENEKLETEVKKLKNIEEKKGTV